MSDWIKQIATPSADVIEKQAATESVPVVSTILLTERERKDVFFAHQVGRMPRKGLSKVLLALPPDLYARIQREAAGSASGVIAGLVQYAIDKLDAEGKRLEIEFK